MAKELSKAVKVLPQKSNDNGAIVPTKPTVVMPLMNADEAVTAFKEYQSLAKKITDPSDVQKIGDKDFKKKSFYRKLAKFFGLSLQLIDEQEIKNGNEVEYRVVYRAIAPNGAFADGDGSCSSKEKGLEKTGHNTRAIAHTRAKNRAISDLCAFGEVSAEEVSDHKEYNSNSTPAKPAPPKAGEKSVKAKLRALIVDQIPAGDLPEKKAEAAKAILKTITYFEDKDGEAKFATDISKMSDKWAAKAYGTLKKQLEEQKPKPKADGEQKEADKLNEEYEKSKASKRGMGPGEVEIDREEDAGTIVIEDDEPPDDDIPFP